MISLPTLWWLVLFIEALVLFPNIKHERIPQWRDFERGQPVQAILTKGGLRLPKVLVMTPSCGPRLPPSCQSAGLGLVAPIWKPLPDASVLHAYACPLCAKQETRTLCGLAPAWRPPGLDRHGLRHEHLARYPLP